jgi:hypothetical protein
MAPAKPARRLITQEAFDAAVAENVDEFGMEPEEALAEAVAGLQLQGVDLSNIRTTLPEEGGRRQLRAVEATLALLAAQEAAAAGDAVRAALATLAAPLTGPNVEPDAARAAGAWPRHERLPPRAQPSPCRASRCGGRRAAGCAQLRGGGRGWHHRPGAGVEHASGAPGDAFRERLRLRLTASARCRCCCPSQTRATRSWRVAAPG